MFDLKQYLFGKEILFALQYFSFDLKHFPTKNVSEWWRCLPYSLYSNAGIGCNAFILHGSNPGPIQSPGTNQLMEDMSYI